MTTGHQVDTAKENGPERAKAVFDLLKSGFRRNPYPSLDERRADLDILFA